MANQLRYFTAAGRPAGELALGAPIAALVPIAETADGAARALVVGLRRGEVRVYVGTVLRHVSQVYGTITAMRYGRYGREEAALMVVLQNGSLIVQMLHRSVSLDPAAAASIVEPQTERPSTGMQPPRLSAVFALQTEREKKYGMEIYHHYHHDLCSLRLLTSQSYLSWISLPSMANRIPAGSCATCGTVGPADLTATLGEGGSGVCLYTSVQGLGPAFKVKGILRNMHDTPLKGLLVIFSGDQSIYDIPNFSFRVPYLLPKVEHPCEVFVELKEGETKGDGITALVIQENSSRILYSILIDLPEAALIETL
ncbi:unnamed protein product [Phytomonas sp. Hart1]|nr:unnamed protein product [Phytomonas sp. Hart1]|eukprot:CCW68928.1 unnamed protein product [Phytomonas sp. isolate Hart1]